MKKIKTLLIVLATISICISCSKDDTEENNDSDNWFTFNNETYKITHAATHSYDNILQLAFGSANFSNLKYTGELDYVQFAFGSFGPVTGNYTYKPGTDYDKATNFYFASAGVGVEFVDGNSGPSNTSYLNPNSGTVNIKKSGDIYTINFSLIFDEGTFEGSYQGKVPHYNL